MRCPLSIYIQAYFTGPYLCTCSWNGTLCRMRCEPIKGSENYFLLQLCTQVRRFPLRRGRGFMHPLSSSLITVSRFLFSNFLGFMLALFLLSILWVLFASRLDPMAIFWVCEALNALHPGRFRCPIPRERFSSRFGSTVFVVSWVIQRTFSFEIEMSIFFRARFVFPVYFRFQRLLYVVRLPVSRILALNWMVLLAALFRAFTSCFIIHQL